MDSTAVVEDVVVELTAMDRCDRCGAQAMTRVMVAEGISELLFCGHHTKEYKNAFDAKGLVTH